MIPEQHRRPHHSPAEDGAPVVQRSEAAPEPTLSVVVASITRRIPDVALAMMVIAGLAGALLVALLAPTWWRVVPAFVLLACVGGWGVAERERESTGSRRLAIQLVRGLIVLASFAASGVMVLTFMGVAIGRWIS